MKKIQRKFNLCLPACGAVALLASLVAASATQTNVIFYDTFAPNGATAATRNDDSGGGYGLDIPWRPRVASQAANLSVVNDAVLGYALRYASSSANLVFVGQFNNDASDGGKYDPGVTLGSSSVPASLGPTVGDKLHFSTQIRTTNTFAGGSSCVFCLGSVPGGPLTSDPGTDNSWINSIQGYYIYVTNGPNALIVPTWKEYGTNNTLWGSTDGTKLTTGITGVTASLGVDTAAHSLMMVLTRQSASSVEIDSYWDNTLVSTATDSTSSFTNFNSFVVAYGPATTWILTDVKLQTEFTPIRVPVETWTGAASGSWATGGNWSPSALANGDAVLYNSSSAAHLTQTLDQNWSVGGLIVSNVGGPVFVSGGGAFVLTCTNLVDLSEATADLTITADYDPGVNGSPTPGLQVAAGRTLTFSNVLDTLNGPSGPGSLRIIGSAGDILDLTNGLMLTLDGGSISAGTPLRLNAGAGDTVRTILTNNAAVSLTGTNGNKINLGHYGTGTDILEIDSGTLNITNSGSTTADGLTVGNVSGCTGILNLNGGTVTLLNKYNSGTSAGETTLFIPSVNGANGVANLNGGTLIVPSVSGGGYPGGTLNFNGTTVVANRTNTAWIAGVANAYVQAGGAIIDSSNYNVTISENLAAPLSGPSGGLTKLGTGTLLLSGGNSYTGPTLVNAGTLAVSNSFAGDLTIADNASLIAYSSGYAAVIAAGNLTLGSSGSTAITLNYGVLYGNPYSPAITVAGALNLGATSITINIAGSGFTVGSFPLVQYSGTPLANLNRFQLGTLPLGMIGQLVNDTANNSIDFQITLAPNNLTWSGNVNATWDTNTANWYNTQTGSPTTYQQSAGVGDVVTFDDSLWNIANTNISLTTALQPAIINVNSYAFEYVFSGPGKITGVSSLNKSGAWILALETANDYSGGSVLSSGPVYLGSDQALGTGTVKLSGASLSSDSGTPHTLSNAVVMTANTTLGDSVNNGQLTLAGSVNINNSHLSILSSSPVILSGGSTNGCLDKGGPATLTFWNCTNYWNTSGEVHDGTMILSNATVISTAGLRPACTVPSGQAELVIGAGSVWENTSTSPGFRVGTSGVGGDPTATNIADIAGALLMPNAGAGTGKLLYSSNYIGFVNLLPGGVATVYSVAREGGTAYEEFDFNGGTLRAAANADSGFMTGLSAAYVRAGGAVIDSTNNNITIAQNLLDGGGNGGLSKLGTGSLTLSGTNTYTGPTAVNAGTLLVNGNSSAVTGHATVNSGATLSGDGTLGAAVSVNSGGTLAAGANASTIGTLTLTNTLALQGTAFMKLSRSGGVPTNDVVGGLAGISYGGSLVVTNISANALVEGDRFVLFSAVPGTYSGSFSSMTLPPLTTGLGWSNSLAASGAISVVSAPAVNLTRTNVSYSVGGGQITLSWPSDHLGWSLQMQTNPITVGLSTNWVTVPGTATNTSQSFPVDEAPTMFFRLVSP